MTEVVGPTRVVLGLDASADALQATQEAVAPLGPGAMHLVQADITTMPADTVAAPGAPDRGSAPRPTQRCQGSGPTAHVSRRRPP